MNERALKAPLTAAKKRIAELERELAEERKKYKRTQPNPVAPSYTGAAKETSKYDPFNPVPNDPVFNALRTQHRRRTSWLE